MIFSSLAFVKFFLPIVLIGYFLIREKYGNLWLVVASLFFYGYWELGEFTLTNIKQYVLSLMFLKNGKLHYLHVIIFSILGNYFFGRLLGLRAKKIYLILGLSFNFLLLFTFKYYNFFVENMDYFFSIHFPALKYALPLGISFFTFTQIAYLVDVYRKEVPKKNIFTYALFISYFPHLLAGPILHHGEMFPQFDDQNKKRVRLDNLVAGLYLFTMGVCKKLVLADTFGIWVQRGFSDSAQLAMGDAWLISLCYTFQLYFDFSGYSDMALGISRMFNIKMPQNFSSPYRSLDIQEFWRKWHMSLGKFLTKYLYIPLGGNRAGNFRTYLNSFLVLFLSGIWHGAGWTFVLWGTLHGLAMVVCRFWKSLNLTMPKWLAWFITFQFLNATWVIFRAKDLSQATEFLKAMFGITNHIKMLGLGGIVKTILFISIGFIIVLFFKNSNEFTRDFKPSMKYALGFGCLLTLGFATLIISSNKTVSEFLYFQF